MKNVRYIFIIVFLYSNYLVTIAQNLNVSGRIIDNEGKALSGASISIFDKDSILIKSMVTDSIGFFQIEKLESSNYFLNASFIGYQTTTVYINIMSNNVNMGDIDLFPEAIGLNEVIVQPKSIIYQDGKQLLFPTQKQKEISSNGIVLLDRLKLPGIYVDAFSNSVSISGGGTIMFCINGREASIMEISALLPHDIIKIEYHQDPGVRYKNATKVLDYIVRVQDSGGYVSVNLTNGLLSWYGEDQISAKLNKGKSAFSLMYYLACRNFKNLWRNNYENFYLNETHFARLEEGLPNLFEYYNNTFSLGYDYQNNDKYLNITFRLIDNNQPHYDWESNLYYSSQPHSINAIDNSNSNKFTPSMNIYYQYPINKNQTVITNINGIYNKENYYRTYQEKLDNSIINDVFSTVDEKQYYISLAALYENKLNFGKFSLGINYEHSFTEDIYHNASAGSELKLKKLYTYSEFSQQIKNLFYRINIGIEQSRYSSNNNVINNCIFRPSLLLQYEINENTFIRYRLMTFNTPPSISSLANYDQAIDSIQIRRGNPFLKSYMIYYNSFNFFAKKNNFGEINLYGHYRLCDHPIMEENYLENDKVIRSIDNQKKLQNINTQADFLLTPLKDVLTLKIWGGIDYYISDGNDYSHAYNILYYGGKIVAEYKKWAMSVTLLQNVNDSFWGETLTRKENGYYVTLWYSKPNLFVGIDILNFLTKNHIGAKENYSKIAPYSRYEYLDEIRNLVRFKFSYNFIFGKQKKSVNKKLSEGDIDSGILKGTK